MIDDSLMTCALCNRKYPYKPDYWPYSLYAECWWCHVKRIKEDHVFALSRLRWGYGFALALAFALNFAIAALVMR